MVNRIELENRIIPYRMLLEATSTMLELADTILPDTAIPSLIYGLRGLESSLADYIQMAKEGLPIIGHHFSFPTEFLYAFECVPVCVEAVSFLYLTDN